MSPALEMKPLSQRKRRIVFGVSILLFVLAVPFSVFYAIGYRFDFTDELTSIKSVGGMYVRSDAEDTEMFVNNEPVEDMRVFQKAAYIQNLEAGMHSIHVQGDAVQTWVKQLPVYAHFVTEVASFNLPKVPQVRVITQWTDPQNGASVVVGNATSSTHFDFASTTNIIEYKATTSTSSLVANAEYTYVQSIFASSTELREILYKQNNPKKPKTFTFDVATTSAMAVTATTTKTWRGFSLFENEGEVFISWGGDSDKVPHYYCVMYQGEQKTTAEYGQHVYDAIVTKYASTTNLSIAVGNRLCRDQIRIDRIQKEVLWFDFFPDSTDVVLMHLRDGLYAVEVDDRAWQNTQLLYPGENLHVIQDGGRIYVFDGTYFMEVFTEIASQT